MPPAVGLASGHLQDYQLSASSLSGSGPYFPPWRARLHAVDTIHWEAPYWTPKNTDTTPWIQVHLLVQHRLTGLVAQGQKSTYYFTKTLEVSFSQGNLLSWEYQLDPSTGVNHVSMILFFMFLLMEQMLKGLFKYGFISIEKGILFSLGFPGMYN